ncbi:alpha/beta fold hydrolase [Nafulsella turpanensis]|uniref:alpha/beta fold hydrolase n=1 Tax=Nafulsella turpanensis TaxID=1265690 RepID=UPI00034DA832|nr:alpha/beta fold hydrolase [Nafulsella turpanensis]
MKLHYRELGEGAPIIILHGLFGSSDNWLSVGKELSGDYKVYLLDQRNHGDSPHSSSFTYTDMAADLEEFITGHKIEDPVIMGHSMGGKTVMKFALSHPDLLQKLIVVDIAPRYYPVHHEVILQGLQAIDINSLKTRREADATLAEYVPELGVRQFLLKNLGRKTEGGYEWKINLPVINEKIENVGEGLKEEEHFEKPTLFIRGANSGYIKDADKALIQQIFPQSQVQTITGAGHWMHAEKPEEFEKVVRAFLES